MKTSHKSQPGPGWYFMLHTSHGLHGQQLVSIQDSADFFTYHTSMRSHRLYYITQNTTSATIQHVH